MKRDDRRDAALSCVGVGWGVVPLFPVVFTARGWVCTCRSGDGCSRPGKHPRIRGAHHNALWTASEVSVWWSRYPDSNIGIVSPDAMLLDIDRHDVDGFAALDELCRRLGPLPTTLTCHTGGNGMHLYFVRPVFDASLALPAALAPGVEVKHSCYFIAPPSRHPSGNLYAWVDLTVPINALPPPWLAELQRLSKTVPSPRPQLSTSHGEVGGSTLPSVPETTRRGRCVLVAEAAKVGEVTQGRRNHQLNKSSFKVGKLLLSDIVFADAWDELVWAGRSAGLHIDETRSTVWSGLSAGWRNPRYVQNIPPWLQQAVLSDRSTS